MEILNIWLMMQMEHLASRRLDFDEFCAATISVYQLEALDGWEQIASSAFEYFEQEGNRVITTEELARVMLLTCNLWVTKFADCFESNCSYLYFFLLL